MGKITDIIKRKKDDSADQYKEVALTEEELNEVTGGKKTWFPGNLVPGGGICGAAPRDE